MNLAEISLDKESFSGTNEKDNSIAIIINSCYKFYKTTIIPIIESAKKAKIPSNNIYIVVGDCDEETDIISYDDYNIVFCKFVNIDYNGIIYFTQTERGLNELQKYSHFFYIHDTALFMDFFYQKINTYLNECKSYIKLCDFSTKNIGLFNVEWFISNKKNLFSYYINYDKSLVLQYKDGDLPNKNLIYNNFNNLGRWLNEDALFLFNNYIPLGNSFKNSDIKSYMEKKYSDEYRLGSLYNEPGIIKYQKNYGQGGGWNLEL
jgi:hypothetical protein